MSHDAILIKGGRIVTSSDDFVGDLLIEDGLISGVGPHLSHSAGLTIDAADKYVLPGMVDPHTHFETPWFDTVGCDDFTSGTVSAAFGGTTCVLHFARQQPGQRIAEAAAHWHELLRIHP